MELSMSLRHGALHGTERRALQLSFYLAGLEAALCLPLSWVKG